MLDFISQPMIGYFSIALLHVFSALYFAAVRWFHVCASYKGKEKVYYPARKWLTLMCLFIMVEVPYVLNPASDICFLTACMVLAWGYPLAAVVVCYAYFKEKNVAKKNYPSFLSLCFLVLAAEVCLSWAVLICPEFCTHYYNSIVVVLVTVSVFIFAVLALFCYALYRKIRLECLDNYSDESYFPSSMGYSALFSMLIIFVLTSLPLLTHSRLFLAVVQGVLIVWHIVFLIYILDSHVISKDENVEVLGMDGETADGELVNKFIEENDLSLEMQVVDETEEENLKEKTERSNVVDEHVVCLLNQIEELMQNAQPYLNPRFTAMDLASELGTNRTYLTLAIKTRYESFYHLVNSYRLEYAEKYLQEHPEVRKEPLAVASGFGSYRSYVRALKSIK